MISDASDRRLNRRELAAGVSAVAATAMLLRPHSSVAADIKPRAKVERLGVGTIGLRYQGSVITHEAAKYGDVVALADVDRNVREQARASFGSTPRIFEDYQDLLKRPDVDVVLIGAPDHWHSKMLIDTVRAGKDVYCEKPLTLTIDEGKVLRDVVGSSDRVVQVGTWQRSDHRFRLAVEMVRGGRIGKLRKVTCATSKNPTGGPFATAPVPSHFNWNLWQGQTPDVPYIPERSHYTFRWWYEYSGGKVTDWGAHHIDIAQWAIDSYPVQIASQAKFPQVTDGFNVASDFAATFQYANGVELEINDTGRSGILFEGDAGRLFVNRGTLAGVAVDQLATKPLPRESFALYDGDNLDRPERVGKIDAITNHMGNLFDCIESRGVPISDLESQHRSVTTCHLANLSMRVGRTLQWDPETEQIIGDPEAAAMQSRPQRSGFEVA
ncbi:Gfo/Idh/MocA family oxidoreductase [Stieleria sp. TO1_6]|uniref:Gfo/Idh/MocA family protein n=1 Tax=Stieleria tagensis TaxID=2956795 RepID=UPI00209B1ADD|nr:Gfo/Idh/MocA family oxidoreductase [Stieleria tagensis]MCO8121741.1 Gfo/Idh/MocA family oxidoreductase [Stieleria tagensis]